MRVSHKDRDSLVILGVVALMILLVVAFYHGTRYIPLRWIGVVILLVEFLGVIPFITKAYLGLYGMEAKVRCFIPVLNFLSTFPKVVAILIICCLSAATLVGVLMILPVGVISSVIGEYNAMNLDDVLMRILNVLMYVFFILLGAGYCSVLRDVRRMSKEGSGCKPSTPELAFYPLLFLPVINLLGLAGIVNGLQRLRLRQYSEADQEEDEELVEE